MLRSSQYQVGKKNPENHSNNKDEEIQGFSKESKAGKTTVSPETST